MSSIGKFDFFTACPGNGFVFHHEAQIGVMDVNGEFIGADEWPQLK